MNILQKSIYLKDHAISVRPSVTLTRFTQTPSQEPSQEPKQNINIKYERAITLHTTYTPNQIHHFAMLNRGSLHTGLHQRTPSSLNVEDNNNNNNNGINIRTSTTYATASCYAGDDDDDDDCAGYDNHNNHNHDRYDATAVDQSAAVAMRSSDSSLFYPHQNHSNSPASSSNNNHRNESSLRIQDMYPSDLHLSGIILTSANHENYPYEANSNSNTIHNHNHNYTDVRNNHSIGRKNGSSDKSVNCCEKLISLIKIGFSVLFLIWCLVLVTAVNIEDKTEAEDEFGIPGPVALLIVMALLIFLGLLEGGMVCMVGMQPVDPELYRESHPIALKCTTLASLNATNLSRYMCGKQFFVVAIVFGIHRMTEAVSDAEVMNLPLWVSDVFLHGFALAMTFVTIVVAQMVPQLVAKDCMVDFFDNHFMLSTVYLSLWVEKSGILHCVYLVPSLLEKLDRSESPQETISPNYSTRSDQHQQNSTFFSLLFWFKVVISLAIFIFAFTVCVAALFDGNTEVGGLPTGIALFIFLTLLLWASLVQGMQVSLFSVMKLPSQQLRSQTVAYSNYKAVFRGGNVENFLIGRQVIITGMYFYLAKLTDMNYPSGETVLGVSSGFQKFLNINLMGTIVTTITMLVGRVSGAISPKLFLSNPLVFPNIYLFKLIGASGIIDAAWPIRNALTSKRWGCFVTDIEILPNLGLVSDHGTSIGEGSVMTADVPEQNDYFLEGDLRIPLVQ